MTPIPFQPTKTALGHAEPLVHVVDDMRGTIAMSLFIVSEAMLFVMLFFAYFYLEKGNQRWDIEQAPKLHYSIPMLVVLWSSSVVLHWGEKQVKKHRPDRGRLGLIGTIALGLGFLALSYFDYSEHLLHLTPRTDSYGSIFYTITTLHVAHVVMGLMMLSWLLFLARRWEPAQYIPHRPYHNVAMYWHFVDSVWFFIILFLYLFPRIPV